MTHEIWFIFGYALLILVAWLIRPVRDFLIPLKAELFAFSSMYVFVLADIKSSNSDIVFNDHTWEDLNTPLIVLGIVVGGTGFVWSGIERTKSRSVAQLERDLKESRRKEEKAKEDYFGLCSANIKSCFKEFFASTQGQGRVSLYRHSEDHFILVGREAQSPAHGKKGRARYPDNEGFISKGWANGRFVEHDIPVWRGNGSSYRAHMKRACNISDEVLSGLNMKSRSFYIHRFDNHDAGNPYGIIVFEKLDPSPISNTVIDPAFERHHDQIVALLKSMKSLG